MFGKDFFAMTRIAFCDDDAALLHQMQDFLEQYRTLRGVQLELFPYTKPMELLADRSYS